jgi:dynein heavy chain
LGIQFRNQAKAPGGWLPLEAYDDKDMDTKAPQAWLTVHRRDPNRESRPTLDQALADGEDAPVQKRRERTEISAKGLWKDRDGLCFWRELKVQRYLIPSERYEGYWESTKEKVRLHRIFILFDEEDPRRFAQRFKKAYETRAMADSLLKYNFYIENMPTHQIPEIDNEAVNRILSKTQNSKQLRGKSSSDTTALLSEVNFAFATTMNKIIFDKHL